MAVNKDGVYIAEDKDFKDIDGRWVYKGEPLDVDITDFVNNKNLTSIRYMFSGVSKYGATAVKRVVLGKNSVTDMSYMFYGSKATSLDLSSFDTSSVTDMSYMFRGSLATSLDLSSFDTSSVTNMKAVFYESQATSLDLSSFDTSSVTDMFYMFYFSETTIGYARTQADADNFNSSRGKPSGLVFVVKPSFGALNNHKIKSMLHKDSNGMIKQVKTLKYKDNLGNITKLK